MCREEDLRYFNKLDRNSSYNSISECEDCLLQEEDCGELEVYDNALLCSKCIEARKYQKEVEGIYEDEEE